MQTFCYYCYNHGNHGRGGEYSPASGRSQAKARRCNPSVGACLPFSPVSRFENVCFAVIAFRGQSRTFWELSKGGRVLVAATPRALLSQTRLL